MGPLWLVYSGETEAAPSRAQEGMRNRGVPGTHGWDGAAMAAPLLQGNREGSKRILGKDPKNQDPSGCTQSKLLLHQVPRLLVAKGTFSG